MAQVNSACPHCGATISHDAKFCRQCGKTIEHPSQAPVSDALNCPHCGKPISANAKFCRACGKAVSAARAQSPKSVVPVTPSAPKPTAPARKPTLAPLLMIALAVVCICATLLFSLAGLATLTGNLDRLGAPLSKATPKRGIRLSDLPPLPAPAVLESKQQTIGANGGSVALQDQARVMFSPGTFTGDVQVTVKKLDPKPYGQSAHIQTTLLELGATTTQFQKPVEIRVPLPAKITPERAATATAWLVDPATGIKTIYPSSVQIVGGKWELLVTTDHFSTWEFAAFSDTPPKQAILAVPYFTQGGDPTANSGFCWAAALQMIAEAAHHSEVSEMFDVVGFMREPADAGLSPEAARIMNPKIPGMLRALTGVQPNQKYWALGTGVGDYNSMVQYIKSEIGNEGRPVMIVNGEVGTGHNDRDLAYANHAYVIVGYDDADNFYVHNPAPTWEPFENGPYRLVSRKRLRLDEVAIYTKAFTVISIPTTPALAADRSLASVNIMGDSLTFGPVPRAPGAPTGTQKGVDAYDFKWDHTRNTGYSFFSRRTGKSVDRIPGDVERLLLQESGQGIEISNATWPAINQKVTVQLDIEKRGGGSKRYHTSFDRELKPGEVWKIPSTTAGARELIIDVNEFREPVTTPTEYVFRVRAQVGGKTVDEAEIYFTLDPSVPILDSLDPWRGLTPGGQVTLKGKGFGKDPRVGEVTFNGMKMPVVSWSETQIVVTVPECLIGGDAAVTVQGITSNTVGYEMAMDYTPAAFVDIRSAAGFVAESGRVTLTAVAQKTNAWKPNEKIKWVWRTPYLEPEIRREFATTAGSGKKDEDVTDTAVIEGLPYDAEHPYLNTHIVEVTLYWVTCGQAVSVNSFNREIIVRSGGTGAPSGPPAQPPTSTSTPTPTRTGTPTGTPTLTRTPTSTATPTSNIPGAPRSMTSTPTRTATPTPTASSGARTEPCPALTATTTTNGQIKPFTFSIFRTDEGEPFETRTRFPGGIAQVHAFYDYAQVRSGVQARALWCLNGNVYSQRTWSWTGNWDANGFAWDRLYADALPSGNYEFRIYLGGSLAQVGRFTIDPPQTGALSVGTIRFAEGRKEGNPVNMHSPSQTFRYGVKEVFAFYEAWYTPQNYTFRAEWYHDGKLDGSPRSDQYSNSEVVSRNWEVLFNNQVPLQRGNWELRLYIDNRLVQRGSFTIQ